MIPVNTLEIKMIPVLYEVTGQTGGENRESKDFPTHSVKDINDKGLLLCFVHLKLKTKKKRFPYSNSQKMDLGLRWSPK